MCRTTLGTFYRISRRKCHNQELTCVLLRRIIVSIASLADYSKQGLHCDSEVIIPAIKYIFCTLRPKYDFPWSCVMLEDRYLCSLNLPHWAKLSRTKSTVTRLHTLPFYLSQIKRLFFKHQKMPKPNSIYILSWGGQMWWWISVIWILKTTSSHTIKKVCITS